MNLVSLSHVQREQYMMQPIIDILLEAGGQLSREELKNRLIDHDESIAEYASITRTSAKTGNVYRQFNFSFNWAIKNLIIAGFILPTKRGGVLVLSNKGLATSGRKIDVQSEVLNITEPYWQTHKAKKKSNKNIDIVVSADR